MEILTASQMYSADKETHAKIMPESQLIQNAGFAAACVIAKRYKKCPVLVLCGNGNNGADGFIVAKTLSDWGWPVEIAYSGDFENLAPTALKAAKSFDGAIKYPSLKRLNYIEKQYGIVIDALFGIGLSRPITGDIADLIEALNNSSIPCIALDIPSGVQADTGDILGIAPICEMTIAFCRGKVGHYLYPAKDYVGELVICDIGIPNEIIQKQNPHFYENDETLFFIPTATPYDHKYTRGSVLICGGEMTGASRLAATAARRAGAGLVKIACSEANYLPYACGNMPGAVVSIVPSCLNCETIVSDPKISAIVIGMGFGVTQKTKDCLDLVSKSGKPFVVDADALGFVRGLPDLSKAVLTPHEGEFSKIFPQYQHENKLSRALLAAKECGCTVVLKGADTIIASADGYAAINADTNFALSTAGSGDVLSGIIGAMLSKGLPPFEAACAGVRIHSLAGIEAGDSLIAEDIIEHLR